MGLCLAASLSTPSIAITRRRPSMRAPAFPVRQSLPHPHAPRAAPLAGAIPEDNCNPIRQSPAPDTASSVRLSRAAVWPLQQAGLPEDHIHQMEGTVPDAE